MKARIIGAALLALVSSHAFAQQSSTLPQPTQECPAPVRVEQGVGILDALGATRIEFLQGAARERVVAAYNAQPPVSDVDWPVVMIADLPDGGGFMALGRDGVFCDRIRFSAEQWPSVRRAFVGPEA